MEIFLKNYFGRLTEGKKIVIHKFYFFQSLLNNEKPNSTTVLATIFSSLKRMILSLTDAKTQWFESHHVLQIKMTKITMMLIWKRTGEK